MKRDHSNTSDPPHEVYNNVITERLNEEEMSLGKYSFKEINDSGIKTKKNEYDNRSSRKDIISNSK